MPLTLVPNPNVNPSVFCTKWAVLWSYKHFNGIPLGVLSTSVASLKLSLKPCQQLMMLTFMLHVWYPVMQALVVT